MQLTKQLRNGFLIACAVAVGSLATTFSANAAQNMAAKKDWTLLVFINGHNNLDSFGAFNLNQMEKVGSTAQVNVVAQWASLAASSTKRLYMEKDNDIENVTSPVIMDMKTVDMGNKDNLLDFIKWGAANYPAEHYMIVVWNHGNGWHFQRDGAAVTRDISNDDISGNKITTEQLGEVMADAASYLGQKVDIYGSDACLMSMVEVVQEMADSVVTVVGSQEVEPGDGWAYDRFLTKLVANPSASSNEVGKMLTEAYISYYQDLGRDGLTFSTIDVAMMNSVVKGLADLRAKFSTINDLSAIKTAAANSQRFFSSDYVDLGDLLTNVKAALGNSSVGKAEIDQVSKALSGSVFANAVTGNVKASGLSVWWPTDSYEWTKYGDRYMGLKFDKQARWSDLLKKLF